MKKADFEVVKSSGERVRFSLPKLRNSLKHSGANEITIDTIINKVREELYQGITTKEIYNRAFALLKKEKTVYASKYKLKQAIYELGPTGFPFERLVGTLFKNMGYQVSIGQTVQGLCVSHEVDVVASKDQELLMMECKFHSEEGRNCNMKIPLYINSRYQDIVNYHQKATKDKRTIPNQGWVVTNTRFTKDAIQFGSCVGLHLLSWDYPLRDGIKDLIDRLKLYPITVSTLLTHREKQFLLSRDIILCKQLLNDSFYLDHLGISEHRKQKILKEVHSLCHP